LLDDFFVPYYISNPKRWQTRLSDAKKVSRTAQTEVGFGDLEAIAGLHHRFDPGLGFRRFGIADQETKGLIAPPADPAAELMKLGKPKTLGMLNNHDGSVGNVYPDLDHRRGD